jgi:deferrochelatase/peroxidase EfeB
VSDTLPLEDIQGLILRGYGMNALSVVVLRVLNPAVARGQLGQLAITTATPWSMKPDLCVNVALTHAGLAALGLPAGSLESFPAEFAEGAVARASHVGDVGPSAPEHWRPSLTGEGVHVLLLVFAKDLETRDREVSRLRDVWTRDGIAAAVDVLNGGMLPGDVAHFGYRDGYSQPTIANGLPNPVPDSLTPAPAGSFLLGYQSQFANFTYPVPMPEALGANGSFVALRILAQDCAAFDKLLSEAPVKYGISGDELAAKFVGRWRNGVPLTLSPSGDSPETALSLEQMNRYDYAPTATDPTAYDDRRGYRCPIGSHMRRNNPRNALIAGNSGLRHRIVRRGLPYGPPFDPAHPDDGVERGLLGLFIAVSLKDQFEFLMSEWVHGDTFAAGISGTADPILGNHTNGSGKFTIPREGAKPIVVTGLPQLVTTRGAAYAFLPSLTAVRYIASL